MTADFSSIGKTILNMDLPTVTPWVLDLVCPSPLFRYRA